MTRVAPRREEIAEDTPLRLDMAAQLAFPDGSITVSSLRREAARGRLQVWRIAGKQMTTLAALRRMMDQCLEKRSPPASGSDQPRETAVPSGPLSIRDGATAQDAARMRAEKLKQSYGNTSPRNTNPSPSAPVIPLKSR